MESPYTLFVVITDPATQTEDPLARDLELNTAHFAHHGTGWAYREVRGHFARMQQIGDGLPDTLVGLPEMVDVRAGLLGERTRMRFRVTDESAWPHIKELIANAIP